METVQFPGLAGLKAFVRPLDLSDLDSCVEVESAFPKQERCSREKVWYTSERTGPFRPYINKSLVHLPPDRMPRYLPRAICGEFRAGRTGRPRDCHTSPRQSSDGWSYGYARKLKREP